MARNGKSKMGRPSSEEGTFKEVRSIRVPDPLWSEVEDLSDEKGCSAFVRSAIEAKVKKMRAAQAV